MSALDRAKQFLNPATGSFTVEARGPDAPRNVHALKEQLDKLQAPENGPATQVKVAGKSRDEASLFVQVYDAQDRNVSQDAAKRLGVPYSERAGGMLRVEANDFQQSMQRLGVAVPQELRNLGAPQRNADKGLSR